MFGSVLTITKLLLLNVHEQFVKFLKYPTCLECLVRCGFPRGPNSKKPFVSLHLEEGRREEGRRFAVIIDSSLAAA